MTKLKIWTKLIPWTSSLILIVLFWSKVISGDALTIVTIILAYLLYFIIINYFRKIKCSNCSTENWMYTRQGKVLTCKKCGNKKSVDIMEIGINDNYIP